MYYCFALRTDMTIPPDSTDLVIQKSGFVKKIASAAASMTSGFAPDDVVATWRKSCFGGDGAPACEKLVTRDGASFCGGCGCGQWPLANLDAGRRDDAGRDDRGLCPRQQVAVQAHHTSPNMRTQ